MRKLLLPLALVLAACFPVAGPVNILAGSNDGARLALKAEGAAGTVSFEAGAAEAQQVALFVGGSGLKITDPKCKPVQNGVGCDLGSVAAGGRYEVKVEGTKLSANVSYYRPGNDRPFLLLAETQ